jgi:hypothetical protein
MNSNTYSYKYTGEETVELAGFGPVTPNQVIETNFEVNNPLFQVVNASGTQTPPPPPQTPTASLEKKEESDVEEKTEGESV